MKILGINGVPYGSTARIMLGITDVATEEGNKTYTVSGCSTHPIREIPDTHIYVGSLVTKALHMFLARITGLEGCFSVVSTAILIRKLKKINPDIVHLHNLHSWYLNLPMLFRYVKRNQIKIVWTLHDCWSFTGHCPHYEMAGCDKWKTKCYGCSLYKLYPGSYIDNSRYMYNLKKKWFTGIKDMTIVTPSRWLARQVEQSYLNEYPIKVIHNGINLSVFKPTKSDFRQKYCCEDKYILLGVTLDWGEKKGIDAFIRLSQILDDKYQIVLVGTNDKIDEMLPDNIITIHRTQNQKELAEIYTAADVFVNPTREDTFPTVNIEAIACGTPVVTFNTGGSPEILDENCGIVVEKNDIDELKKQIINICENAVYNEEACTARATVFDNKDRFKEYLEIYRSL